MRELHNKSRVKLVNEESQTISDIDLHAWMSTKNVVILTVLYSIYKHYLHEGDQKGGWDTWSK
jgi:hypothetical protein